MAGQSPSTTGVNVMSRPSTSCFSEHPEDVDARHKAGHDGVMVRRLGFWRSRVGRDKKMGSPHSRG